MATKRNYRKEYDSYHSKPAQRKARSSRNKARRKMKAAGAKIRGREVDHKNKNPNDNRRSNLRAVSRKTNRSRKK